MIGPLDADGPRFTGVPVVVRRRVFGQSGKRVMTSPSARALRANHDSFPSMSAVSLS